MAAAALALPATAAFAQERSAGAAQQPPIQARPGGPDTSPRTDQTIDVAKGTRLVLTNNAGEAVVRSWDRDQVRVQATHSERTTVDVQTADATVRVRAKAARGPASMVDYVVTVPRWMPVNLSGTYLEATIEGTTAEVTVETVHGNVRVVGGSGTVSARSVEGRISIDKASGKVRVTTINEGIRLTNVSGDMSVDTTNGDIWIDNAQTSSLEVSTVNGNIVFNGTLQGAGAYRLTTHDGDIRVGLNGTPNATVFVRTFDGSFRSDFPIQLPEGQSARSGNKRFNFTLGSGSARLELQTFDGDIQIARSPIQPTERDRRGWPNLPNLPNLPHPPAPPAPRAPRPPGDWTVSLVGPLGWHVHDTGVAHDDAHAGGTLAFELHDLDLEVDVDIDVDVNPETPPRVTISPRPAATPLPTRSPTAWSAPASGPAARVPPPL